MPAAIDLCLLGSMRRALSSSFSRIGLAVLGLTLGTLAPTPAQSADSLATPMTGQSARELWPLDVTVEIVDVTPSQKHSGGRLGRLLETESVTVRDGHRLQYSTVVLTPNGQHRVDLVVVPRHHPDTVEIEWDLEVREAPYAHVSVQDYLLHRLGVGPTLQLQDEALRVARSDIENTKNDRLRRRVRVDDQVYEIRIHAAPGRG